MSGYTVRRVHDRGQPSLCRESRGPVAPASNGWGKLILAALAVITVVGTVAMLWVGGHIILVGTDELGFPALYSFVHHLETPVTAIAVVGGFLGWLVNTFFSLILGAVWGAIAVGVVLACSALLASRKNVAATEGKPQSH